MDLHLGCIAGAYRSTPSETTKLTPNLLSIGREVRMPADLIFGHKNAEARPTPEYADHVLELKEKMYTAHEIARKYLLAAPRGAKNFMTRSYLSTTTAKVTPFGVYTKAVKLAFVRSWKIILMVLSLSRSSGQI